MRKIAATLLALALATTHGLLEGGHVQKKDDLKGLRGAAKVDSSLERAAVGRKLGFGYHDQCPIDTSRIPDPRFCPNVCSNDETLECEKATDCVAPGVCEVKVTGYPPCDTDTCRCCDGKLPVSEGDLEVCVFPSNVCSNDPSKECLVATVDCGSVTAVCVPVPPGDPCFETETCCTGEEIDKRDERCPFEPGEGPCSEAPTPDTVLLPRAHLTRASRRKTAKRGRRCCRALQTCLHR